MNGFGGERARGGSVRGPVESTAETGVSLKEPRSVQKPAATSLFSRVKRAGARGGPGDMAVDGRARRAADNAVDGDSECRVVEEREGKTKRSAESKTARGTGRNISDAEAIGLLGDRGPREERGQGEATSAAST